MLGILRCCNIKLPDRAKISEIVGLRICSGYWWWTVVVYKLLSLDNEVLTMVNIQFWPKILELKSNHSVPLSQPFGMALFICLVDAFEVFIVPCMKCCVRLHAHVHHLDQQISEFSFIYRMDIELVGLHWIRTTHTFHFLTAPPPTPHSMLKSSYSLIGWSGLY